jgi:tRNA pseudouridine13 synthase
LSVSVLDLAPRALPFLTHDLPGIGGSAKVLPEDFVVEEIPAYLPLGAGEHLYLWIEKRGLSTQEAIRILANAAGVSERDVGAAGQKDRHAVTRQWLSIHTKLEQVESPDARLRVLEHRRHGNKLRTGHVKGNRFMLVLRGVHEDALSRAGEILDALGTHGLPNFYDAQRFGRRGDNALLGAALLGMGEHPEQARARRDRFLKRLALSALQSELFNRVLTTRLASGWTTVIPGDVLRKRASGGVFVTEDPSVDQPRVDSLELDITGPLPGNRERPEARVAAREIEDAVLREAGVERAAFARGGDDAEGARRPLRVPVGDARAQWRESGVLELSFALPSGAYATRVLAELMKSGVDLPGEESAPTV